MDVRMTNFSDLCDQRKHRHWRSFAPFAFCSAINSKNDASTVVTGLMFDLVASENVQARECK